MLPAPRPGSPLGGRCRDPRPDLGSYGPGAVGTQTAVQQVPGVGGERHQRVIATHLGVPALRALVAGPHTWQMVESTSIVNKPSPGPTPCCQALKRPAADGVELAGMAEGKRAQERAQRGEASTRWPSTLPGDPARSRSLSSIQLPPASAEWISVIAM
jgi:hypothetical protein